MTSNKVRLNKFLAECGIDSRRKVEELITQGRIIVNGEQVHELAFKVDPAEDKVFLDGEPIRQQKKAYYMLNKPKGYVTTTSDEKNRKTVMELVRSDVKIFPVGRLDFNTTGLLLLTNDGDFTNLLLHPNNKVPRIYRVALDKMLEEKDRLVLIKGIMLDGKRGRFEDVRYKDFKNKKQVTIKTVEGRNHFVKDMFKVLGYKVTSLCRIKFAGFSLGDMPIGAYRELTRDEVKGTFKKNV